METVNTVAVQSDEKPWLFKPGQSGNPAGKPKGARHRTTLAAQTLLEGQAEALTQRVLQMALGGDITALKLCLDRIAPVRKDQPITFDLPEIGSTNDAMKTLASVLSAVAAGDITPGEANEVAKLIDSYIKAVEANEFEQRLKALESNIQNGNPRITTLSHALLI